jgi:thiamine-phosphate pyrophosphorylase
MKKFPSGLYPVLTEEFCAGRDMLEVLRQVMDGGAKIVQLRQKNKPDREIFFLAEKYRAWTLKYQSLLILNDRLDLALAVDADGIHLGQQDLPCSIARKLAPHLLIGISTHTPEDIHRAEQDGASYVNIGPIFSTKTKNTPIPPLGPDYLRTLKTKLPFSVMGGIKRKHIKTLLKYGAKTIAMVTEITQAKNISKTVQTLIAEIS